MSEFDAQNYWEKRLRDHFSLEGVGYLRLGKQYNEWMYKVRRVVFDRVAEKWAIGQRAPSLREAPAQPRAAGSELRVIDIGSGTGFYVERWLARGARVTGVDITDVAVSELRGRFPQATFLRADIGAALGTELAGQRGSFDAASAFDVLFHIVDDERYARALANIGALLKPGGWFLWSDNFIHRPTMRVVHQASRSLAESTAAVQAAGFEIVDRVPMFVLMNYPIDTTSRLAHWAWTAMVSPALLSDALGGLLGRMLFGIECRLVASRRESPTTELMICRKR
ncbi:MAG: class I SAM-dependent methyltransferase [Gemmatimonadota bacterium]